MTARRVLAIVCRLILLVAAAGTARPVLAQMSSTPPSPEPARWWGQVWGTAEVTPKIVRPGDEVTIVATTWNGGASEPGWACGGGWRVVGTSRVAVARMSGCFDLVDYEPKASPYVNVSVAAGEVVWEGLPGPPPTDNVDRYYSYVYSADCYCWVGWSGSSGRTEGCPKPIGTFRKGQTFTLRLKAKNTPSCSTRAQFVEVHDAASFGGWNGVGWSNGAEAYYRFDYNASNTPVPTLDVTTDVVSVEVGQSVEVRALVKDATTGAPMPGQSVSFKTTVGLLDRVVAITGADGVATVTLSDDGRPGRPRVAGSIPQAADFVDVEFTQSPTGGGGGGTGEGGGGTGTVLKQYFAEGSTQALFTTDLALVNPGETHARATLRFYTAEGANLQQELTVRAHGRASVRLNTEVPGLGQTAVSTVVESAVPLVADRTMTWDATGYGSHSETGIAEPRATWYLAEGATHSGFQLFYLIQNPADAAANVEVTYLRPAPLAPVVRRYDVAARSRFNIWVNLEGPELAATDVSAVIESSLPVIVERAMYLDARGQSFGAGHESAAIREPAERWFFAEGATGPFFDLFVLVANPDTRPALVRATYLLPDGTTVTRSFEVGPRSRFNIWVDNEGGRLADTAVSTVIESLNGVPVIAERAMWWPGSGWHEAHNAPGSTATGTRWAVAGGEVGGPRGAETYLLIANTSDSAARVDVTVLLEDGTTLTRQFAVAARSRFNVNVGQEFPVVTGRRFGATVTSTGETPAQLVVERAVYSNAGGVAWAAGANALATRLP